MSEKEIDEVTGVATTGHEFDGIKELNNPMPRWWLWTFYATVVWAIGYTILYPAWPMFTSATSGALGWSSRQDLTAVMEQATADQADLRALIAEKPLAEIIVDEPLRRFAAAAGEASFKVNCVQCHGSGGQGAPGYPNLNDDDWIWGGDVETIYQTIAHGVRFAGDENTRFSEMPAFAGMLQPAQIREVAAYVASFTREPSNREWAEAGKQIYADNCAVCHGDAGRGDQSVGAPNLADAIWFYGSSEDEIAAQVRNPRHGVMPAWLARLGDTGVKELTVYIHSLGGAE